MLLGACDKINHANFINKMKLFNNSTAKFNAIWNTQKTQSLFNRKIAGLND